MIRSVPVGEIRRLGDRALLVGVHDAAAARSVVRALQAAAPPGLDEVVGGLATVMVSCAPGHHSDALRPWLDGVLAERRASPDREHATGGDERLVQVPCTFTGPDLPEVAELAGGTPAAVVDLLTAQPLTVAVVGFSPGFAYLAGLPRPLNDIPRRAGPRPSVPAGSVALANGYAAVYPSASPGGWQLIGHTKETFFTPTVAPYARLAPGDRVQFTREAAAPRGEPPPAPAPPEWVPPPSARPVFEVEEAGLRTVLQDGGRHGLAGIGVPSAGPADPYSFELANRLVGNPTGAGALEVTARGPTLRGLAAATYVAVVGAQPDLRLDGQPVEGGQVVPVWAGQRLQVGPLERGLRAYLSVAGGLVGPTVLGSTASDQLAGLGPGPIARGAHLWAGPLSPPLGDHVGADAAHDLPPGQAITLRVVPGPHPERFVPGAFAALARLRFTVGDASNRVGVRLHHAGDPALLARADGVDPELDSQGTVTGAVQVPPDGEPVMLLPDHATLGGYPVLAVVAAVDHGLLGQCAPGASVSLAPIDFEEADAALRARRRTMEKAVRGHYPLAVG